MNYGRIALAAVGAFVVYFVLGGLMFMVLPMLLLYGLSILAAIRDCDYDVWTRRPTVSRGRQLRLLWQCWRRGRRGVLREKAQ